MQGLAIEARVFPAGVVNKLAAVHGFEDVIADPALEALIGGRGVILGGGGVAVGLGETGQVASKTRVGSQGLGSASHSMAAG